MAVEVVALAMLQLSLRAARLVVNAPGARASRESERGPRADTAELHPSSQEQGVAKQLDPISVSVCSRDLKKYRL